MIAHAPTLFAEDADTVGLVDHDGTVVLVLQFNDLRQLGQVAFHREDTIDHDELDGLVRQLLQHALQIGHIVVLIVQLTSERQAAAIHDGGMITIIADDIVVLAHYHCQNTLVHGETRREAEAVFLADEL